MKPKKDWIAKILCVLLAAGIWYLIKSHLGTLAIDANGSTANPPKAIPVDEKAMPKRR